jgi:hypothetical protein
MSNPTKIYNDYVRANLPSTMTFDSTTDRYDINNHSFLSFNKASWYFKYVTKYGYTSLSTYAVNNFDPDFVLDFKKNYYRKGGSDSTLSGSVTHARAGNATMVDSDGLLKWAPHNLQRYSEEFNNSTWLKSGTSVTANAATAPNGELLADLLYPTSGGGLIYDLTTNTDPYKISCFVKSAGFSWVAIGTNTDNTDISWFNLGSGVVGTVGSNMASSSITSVGDGWYLCSTTTTTAVGGNAQMAMWPTNGDGSRDSTPNGTDGLYIWGAHCHKSDLGGMVNNPARGDSYVPTTSSAVYLPRVGHHIYNGSAWVKEGVLHESEARTNLIAHSNNFTDASWTKFRVGITENVSGVTGPDGTQTVDKITPIATNEQHRVWYGVSSTAVGETYSAYVKSAGYDYVWVGYYEAPAFKYAIVNLTNGAVTSSNADNYSVEDVSNGFYRISVTKTTSGSSRYISISPSPTASPTIDANGALTYLGDGTSGVYVYGTQIEAGSTPSSYIPTSGSTVTRAAETLTVPAANMPYSSTNMSIQIDGKMTGKNLTHIRWFEDADDAILLETGTNNFTFTQEAGGTVDTVTGGSFTSGNLLAFNTASRHGSGFINGAISGTALTVNTTPSALPDLADNNLVLGYDFMGTIAQFRMWDEDLTDTGIAEAST